MEAYSSGVAGDDNESSESEFEDEATDEDHGQDDGQGVEAWVDWLRRVTYEGEDAMRKVNLPDWVEEQRRRKWSWAGHLARRGDQRWTVRVLDFVPEGARPRGRPCTRWTDAVDHFLERVFGERPEQGHWRELAQDRPGWHKLVEDFAGGG